MRSALRARGSLPLTAMDMLRGVLSRVLAAFSTRESAARTLSLAGAASALAFLAVETHKSWPMSYHLRLFALLFRCRFFPRKLFGLGVPIVSRSRVRLSDLDYHGHVNNAQYALDADLMGRCVPVRMPAPRAGRLVEAEGCL